MEAEIKRLYEKLPNKTDFMIRLSKIVKRSPKTLRSHWFSKDPLSGIPADQEKIVLRELKKELKIKVKAVA